MTFDPLDQGAAGMPEDDDDDIPAASMSMLVGNLQGRMRAHERRMDRHETWVGEKFATLESKVDGVDGKLDELKELLAGQAGGRAVLRFFMQPAVVILGAICSVVGAVLLHLLKVN
jgi:hypothetical protein